MFLIGLRTITFLFYLIKEKKRNTLAILLKAIASFKVIIPFSEYEVINRNSKKDTRAPADMSKFKIKSSGDLGFLTHSTHLAQTKQQLSYMLINLHSCSRMQQRVKQYMVIFSPAG